MKKIVISTTSFGKYDMSPIDECQKAGYAVVLNPYGRKITPDELIRLAGDAVGLIAGTENLSADVIAQLSELKVISRCGVGLDNIDLEAVRRAGIKLFNTPDAPTQAVAELTVGLMLACLRHIAEADRHIRKGKWVKPMGTLLQSKTVGVVGFGRIGRTVSSLVKAFGANVLAFDVKTFEENAETRMVSFDELIRQSDIVTLHIPAGASEEFLITAEVIHKMKKSSCLVNASRGGLVDEDALYDALKSGRIGAAALDTFNKEPYPGPLINLENVVLTPHIGSYAQEARILMERQAAENLLKGLGVKK